MRNKWHRLLYFVLFLSSSAVANAAVTDLLQTYQEALQNDPTYASARAAFQAGQEKSIQGRALLLPTLISAVPIFFLFPTIRVVANCGWC